VKEHYLTRVLTVIDSNGPGFGESRWVSPEDVNVEYLLDAFTTIAASGVPV